MALLFTVFEPATSQRIVKNGLDIVHSGCATADIEFSIDDYTISSLESGHLLLTSPATNSYSREAGKPQLPLFQQIVVIPSGSKAQVLVTSEAWEKSPIGGNARLCPAVGARRKEEVSQTAEIDSIAYLSGTTYQLPLASLVDMGCVGKYRIARLTLSPFKYNAANNTLAICRHLSATIVCNNNESVSLEKAMPFAELSILGLRDYIALGFSNNKDYSNSMAVDEAIHIVTVAPRRFRKSLNPLISWQRQQGYIVEEIYMDSATASEIKERLQQRYDMSDDEIPHPMYLTLVGDVADIPMWPARQHIAGIDLHSTDMPYVEFTGDSLPDALWGRISVNDTAELNRVVEKTLAYEKGLFADTAYLHRSLLVAGSEEHDQAPIVTNGQVNYLKEQLLRLDPLHDTICYYNPESDSAADEIYAHLRQSGSLISYTAHCLEGGWRHPTIMYPMVDSLPEDGKPFLAVNNCCRTNAISGECFGEHLLRKANGGAIGAIGATNETLWDEDYYWSVGNRSELTTTPEYQPAGCGAFDRLMHTHGEEHSQWALTQGQIVAAGNWAVTRSGSPYWAFYWEIYCLLGDPTLMPYIGVPYEGVLNIGDLHLGDTAVALHGTPFARVAATRADTLLGICTLDGNGDGVMICPKPLKGNVLFTSTAQYHKPVQQSVALGPNAADSPQLQTGNAVIKVYPNPSDGQITISGMTQPSTVDIYDLHGHRVAHFNADANEPIQWLPESTFSGANIYIISVDNGSKTTTQKVTIIK